MNGGKVYGRLTLEGDEHPIPIRDKRLAIWVAQVVERESKVVQAFTELADYRVAWQTLTARHNRLERCWWSRLGRWLRLAPRAETASQHERRVVASEVRAAMQSNGKEAEHGGPDASAEPGTNGTGGSAGAGEAHSRSPRCRLALSPSARSADAPSGRSCSGSTARA